MNRPPAEALTDRELEVMHVFWDNCARFSGTKSTWNESAKLDHLISSQRNPSRRFLSSL